MAYKPKILLVVDSGTGSGSHTAYAVLCGGTSSTGDFQSVASIGSSGDVLTSNGAGSLPSFQAPSSGNGLVLYTSTVSGNPTDGSTYFLGAGVAFTTITSSGRAGTRMYITESGTITKVYGSITVSGTLGSNENCTLALRLNDTTDTTVTSVLQLTAADNAFSNTGLSISVSAGDYVEFKFVSPTWGTNPIGCRLAASVLIT